MPDGSSTEEVSQERAHGAAPAADFNLKILAPLAKYLRDVVGKGALEEVCTKCEIKDAVFDGPGTWISWEQFEAFLAEVRARVGSDDKFREACVHRLGDSYGPMKFVTWATSARVVLRLAERTGHMLSKVGAFKVVGEGDNFIKLRYTSSKPESKLLCVSRQAQSAWAPRMWDLPPAFLREGKCIAAGDDCCEYTYFLVERTRKWPLVVGGVLGFGLFLLARWSGVSGSLIAPLFVAFGAAVAFILERRRTDRAANATQHEIAEALRQVVSDDAEARRELLELHKRQSEWTRILEEEAAERHSQLQRIVEDARTLDTAREKSLMGFSHDLKNPLSVVVAAADFFKQQRQLTPDQREALDEVSHATKQMMDLLQRFVALARERKGLVELVPQRTEVTSLTDRLRRRLKALVHGRDIRSSVFSTREAPETIEVDPLLFDRVTDNLMTNAVKYTERGSIVIELDGTPGFLVIKISDTGRGIEAGALEHVFKAGGSDPKERARHSSGVGLSVVVELLAQVGGKLEVMSTPGKGTTFWVHLPVGGTTPERQVAEHAPTDSAMFRVVKIRRSAS